jgi:hypothetical protein
MNPLTLFRDDSHLYPICGDDNDFFTGMTADGLQVLVVVAVPTAIAVFFDREGRLIKNEERHLVDAGRTGVFAETDERQLYSWLQSLGYKKGIILVRRFFISQYHIGVFDFPDSFSDILLSSSNRNQEERDFAQRELNRWASEGLFQLWLNPDTDLWIDSNGNIAST